MNKWEDNDLEKVKVTIEIQFDITLDLLKAINKQIEELRWNNE